MLGGAGSAAAPRKRAPPVKDRAAEETLSLGHPVRTSEVGQNPPPHRPLPLKPGELAASAAGASLQGRFGSSSRREIVHCRVQLTCLLSGGS